MNTVRGFFFVVFVLLLLLLGIFVCLFCGISLLVASKELGRKYQKNVFIITLFSNKIIKKETYWFYPASVIIILD